MTPVLKTFLTAGAILGVLQGPTIRHQGLEYVSNRQFPRIEVEVDRPELVRSAKLYFRAEQYSDFYYVELVRDEDRDRFFAILPIPVAGTASVIYFVEIVDTGLNTVRSALFEAKVTAQAVAGSFEGARPNINVGSTARGGAEFPPGFRRDGIDGIINSDGTIRPVRGSSPPQVNPPHNGGGGAAAAILVGAGAAAGVGYLVLRQKEDEPPPPPDPTADVSVTKTPSIFGQVQVRSTLSFVLLAANAGPNRATNVELTDNLPFGYRITGTDFPGNASCTLSGQSIRCTASTLDPGETFLVAYDVLPTEAPLTLTNRVEVRAAERDPNSSNNSAEVVMNVVRAPQVADVSVDVTTDGKSTFQVVLRNNGPTGSVSNIGLEVSESGVAVEYRASTFQSTGFSQGCPGAPTTPNGLLHCQASLGPGQNAQLTFQVIGSQSGSLRITASTPCGSIDPSCLNNTDTVEITYIPPIGQREVLPLSTALSSRIDSPSRGLRGEAALDGQSLGGLASGSPRRIPFKANPAREHLVEAWTSTASPGEGRWEFSFRDSVHFVRGSLVVDSGQVMSLEGDRLVFRLSGAPGERLRFRFRLEAER